MERETPQRGYIPYREFGGLLLAQAISILFAEVCEKELPIYNFYVIITLWIGQLNTTGTAKTKNL